MSEISYIGTGRCSTCNSNTSVVYLHHHGTNVFNVCKSCDKMTYESVASDEKENYMRTGRVRQRRVS